MKHLKVFESTSEYDEYIGKNTKLPLTSVCKGTIPRMNYNPENRITAKFNVTSTSSYVNILRNNGTILQYVSKIFVDDEDINSIRYYYRFQTTGVHTVKYYLVDNTQIPSYMFYGCTDMISVMIPPNFLNIGSYAFTNCSGLSNVFISEGVKKIDNYCFRNCTALTSITIPNSVLSFGNHDTFNGCTSLTDIKIGDGLERFSYDCFKDCSSLTHITIPKGMIYINGREINQMESVDVDEGNYKFYSPEGSNAVLERRTNILYAGCKNTIIPNTVTSINIWAFLGCTGLTSIGGVGSGASLEIPNSVTSIGIGSFRECTNLIEVTIPNTVTSIGNNAFEGCTYLTSVTIGNSVTSIGENAFYNCSALTSITIPDSVTSIGAYTFVNCSSLTSVTMGNSVTYIGDRTFVSCTGLTSIGGVGSGASVEMPNTVTNIRSWLFDGCTGLTNVVIHKHVDTIISNCFNRCYNIESIVVNNDNTTYDSRDNCNAIIKTSTNMLVSGCKNTVIPNSVTSIEASAFSGHTGLTEITIPNSVTYIGNHSFYGCTGLTSITLPNSVTTIGDSAFNECRNLESVIVEATTPPTLGGTSVFSSNASGRKIYVPAESVEAYKEATNWSAYADYIEAIQPD